MTELKRVDLGSASTARRLLHITWCITIMNLTRDAVPISTAAALSFSAKPSIITAVRRRATGQGWWAEGGTPVRGLTPYCPPPRMKFLVSVTEHNGIKIYWSDAGFMPKTAYFTYDRQNFPGDRSFLGDPWSFTGHQSGGARTSPACLRRPSRQDSAT